MRRAPGRNRGGGVAREAGDCETAVMPPARLPSRLNGQNPRRRARLAASGCSRWTAAEAFSVRRAPGRNRGGGVAREAGDCETAVMPPARLPSRPCGRNPRQWATACGFGLFSVNRRGGFFRASRAGKKSGWWSRPGADDCETAVYASGTSVQLPVWAESAAAERTACSFRPSSMDGRGVFPCATQSRKE